MRILQVTTIIMHCVAGVSCWIILWALSGILFTEQVLLFIYILWPLLSFSANWWGPLFFLGKMNIRKTISEEELWINPLLKELNDRSKIETIPQLFILEDPSAQVFATGRYTVVLSRGIIRLLNEAEIKAVLAHEYGHLKDRDPFIGSAYWISTMPMSWIYAILCKMRLLLKWQKTKPVNIEKWLLRKILLGLMVLFILTRFPESLIILLILYFYYRLYPYLATIMNGAWCYFMRVQEFKQDQFAQSLGYGLQLKKALLKISTLKSQHPINLFSVFQYSHPILSERIRKIESLEGLRNDK